MNEGNSEQHSERNLLGRLADVICGLDQSIAFLTRNLHLQHDWFKAHQDGITKDDLKRSTDKIIAAIRASNPTQDAAIVKATQDLKASNDALQAAVDKNK